MKSQHRSTLWLLSVLGLAGGFSLCPPAGAGSATFVPGTPTSTVEVIHVPGDYADLQDAIDGASPGARILVHGGIWTTIVIDKPLTLVGSPRPLIQGESSGFPSYAYVPPITLAGPGSGEVILSNIEVFGTVLGYLDSVASPGITGGGFGELQVYDSEIRAPEWSFLTGLGAGKPGIEVSVPFVLVERSLVKGSRTDNDSSAILSGVDGPPGISAADSIVVVLDSTVQGGASGVFRYPSNECDFGCPGGQGGAGVVCETLYHAASTFQGGAGATWETQDGSLTCCQYLDGPPIVASTVKPLANDLVGEERRMRQGSEYVLHLATPGPTATLRGALGIGPPVLTPGGERFLDLSSTMTLGEVSTPGDYVLKFSSNPTLVGQVMAFQLVDPTTGFSRPVAGVVLPANLRQR